MNRRATCVDRMRIWLAARFEKASDCGAGGQAPRPRRSARRRSDAGAVTAEFAVVLPAVVVVAAVLIALSRTVVVSMGCQDAASAAVREIVVSGDEADPAGAVRSVAGSDASVTTVSGDATVTVSVSCPVIPDPLGILPVSVTAEATGVVQ